VLSFLERPNVHFALHEGRGAEDTLAPVCNYAFMTCGISCLKSRATDVSQLQR
jgi:hypothetical protein